MFFLQAVQAPVLATIVHPGGRTVLSIPKLQMDDLVTWMVEYKATQLEKQTEGLDDARKREYEKFYGAIEPDINQISALVRTPEGTKNVVRMTFPNATKVKGPDFDFVTQDGINTLIKTNGFGRLFSLVIELADLADKSLIDPDPDNKMLGDNENKEPETPLTLGVKTA